MDPIYRPILAQYDTFIEVPDFMETDGYELSIVDGKLELSQFDPSYTDIALVMKFDGFISQQTSVVNPWEMRDIIVKIDVEYSDEISNPTLLFYSDNLMSDIVAVNQGVNDVKLTFSQEDRGSVYGSVQLNADLASSDGYLDIKSLTILGCEKYLAKPTVFGQKTNAYVDLYQNPETDPNIPMPRKVWKGEILNVDPGPVIYNSNQLNITTDQTNYSLGQFERDKMYYSTWMSVVSPSSGTGYNTADAYYGFGPIANSKFMRFFRGTGVNGYSETSLTGVNNLSIYPYTLATANLGHNWSNGFSLIDFSAHSPNGEFWATGSAGSTNRDNTENAVCPLIVSYTTVATDRIMNDEWVSPVLHKSGTNPPIKRMERNFMKEVR